MRVSELPLSALFFGLVKSNFWARRVSGCISAPTPLVMYVDGYTPLHYACKNDQNGQVKTVELLLLNHLTLDVNVPNDDGLTPLHLACMYGLTKVVKLLLLEPNIDIEIEDRQGRTPLMLAKQNNHSITIRQFEKGTKTCIML